MLVLPAAETGTTSLHLLFLLFFFFFFFSLPVQAPVEKFRIDINRASFAPSN